MQVIKTSLFVIVFLFISIISTGYSKERGIENKPVIKAQNYINGIQSNNSGLRKSCIQFAGAYRLKETKPALMTIFGKTKDVNEKILIAISLYLMDTPYTANEQLDSLMNSHTFSTQNLADYFSDNKYLDK